MKTDSEYAYRELLYKVKDIAVLSSVEGILNWDMKTMMPPGGIKLRSEQLAVLSRIHHKLNIHPEIGRLLGKIQTSANWDRFDKESKRNVLLIAENFQEQTALSEKLVSDIARQQALTINVWKKAKAKKSFNIFKADLQKLFSLSRELAETLMKVKKTKTSYDALIDAFEPKMHADKINEMFAPLLVGLEALLIKIEQKGKVPSQRFFNKKMPIENQRKIAQLLTNILGFDTNAKKSIGRIDETEHPFTSGYYDDIRITTHYYPTNFLGSIFPVLHETGHAIYEKNMNPKWKYQPIGSLCSYGIHESQSKFYENIIGRSFEFWKGILPKINETAPTPSKIQLDDLIYDINRINRSHNRVQADEVTYNIHIIIRFELERDLFSGKINVNELPQVWNQKYSDYLRVEIANDSEGVLQDIHWAWGLFGYFPTYTLGNLYAGQLAAALTKSLPNWRDLLSKTNLKMINDWLKFNIHYNGNLYDPEDLIKMVTGSTLNVQPFLDYLTKKYC